MRVYAAVLVLGAWLLVGARPAAACGFWSMTDTERGVVVGYLINSASIEKGTPADKNRKRLGVLYFDVESKQGLRVVRDRKVVLEIRGDKLLHNGKRVATIGSDGSVTFGETTYTIELGDHDVKEPQAPWKLTVKRDAHVVLVSDGASALCAGAMAGLDDAREIAEIQRRVIYYLAWRAGFR